VRLVLELVRQRIERGGLAEAVSERLRDHPVGEPRVPREQRAMKVRADGSSDAAALPAALAVVPKAGDNPAEGLGARVERRSPGVILESRQGAVHAGLELALEQDVADHARLAGGGFQGK
jgi:hypothetical protein